MTLNTTYSPTVADGNGVTKSFSYSFNPISENYLKVSLEQNGSWVEQVSGWTATVSENGGVVTFDTAPTTRVAIERDVPEEQPTSYKTSSGFQAQVIEHSFDMLTGMVQELKEKSDRSIAVDVGSSVNPQEVVTQVERVYDSIDNIDSVADDLTTINAVNNNKTNIDTVAGDKANIDKVASKINKVDMVAVHIDNVDTVSSNINSVNQVAGIKNDVVAVSGIKNDVTAVNANKTNINKVAGDINRVNLVADDIASVHTVAVDISNVIDVADNKTNIDTVAGDITNVNYVGGSINSVNSVAGDLTNIDAVNNNKTNIDTVAGSITNVNLVGADINKVADVADDLTNIDAVNANKTNIDKVASIKDDVTAVAGIQGDVMAVAADAATITAIHGDLSNIDAVNANKTNIDAVANNISSVNTVVDKIPNIDTVATNIGAVNTAASNISAINNAPTYAAQAKQWAIGVPGEPTEGSAKYWAGRAEDAASGMENPANRDLSNLTADGQKIIDTVDGKISNFMSEVPQNIKLTLENNVVTMKAGSTLLKGGTVYTTYTLTEDKTYTIPNTLEDGRYFLYTNATGTPLVTIQNRFGSGTTLPADPSVYGRFFITTNTTFYNWSSAQNAWVESGITYPSAMIDVVNGVASFAKDSNGNDMIFNGIGFVGHHIFIYPNINAYMPAELNPDGSLASTKIGTNALRIIEALSGYGVDSLKRWISLQSNRTVSNWSAYKEVNHDSEADYSIANIRYYARDINLIKMYRSGSVSAVDGVPLVEYYYDGSNITSFSPKQCVRLATVDMLSDSYTKDEVDTKLASKQDTLVSGTNIKTINSTTVLGNGNFALADQSLSNLDSNGQIIVDSQNGTISNCILEIPQNLKLEISGDTFTIKSGSTIVLVGATYTTYTLTSDTIVDYSTNLPNVSNGLYYIFANSNGTVTRSAWIKITNCFSGTPLPNASDYPNSSVFFETSEKKKWYNNNGTWIDLGGSYPLGLFEVKNHQLSFAKDSNGNDMIFNGAGFVGHHAFVFPNVKGLWANGKDVDGVLKSGNAGQSSLKIFEMASGQQVTGINRCIGLMDIAGTGTSAGLWRGYAEVDTPEDLNTTGWVYVRQYVKSENRIYQWNGSVLETGVGNCNGTPLIDYAYDGTTVTDFTIRQPVRTATVEMLNNKQDVLTFDNTPTASSTNPVTSGGVYTALGTKQDTLTFDSTPTQNSTNPVTSGGLYNVLGDVETLINAL